MRANVGPSIASLILFIILTMAARPATSQPLVFADQRELLQGWMGDLVVQLIDAINENDSAAVANVINEGVTEQFRAMAPMSRHIEVFRSTYRQTGGIDFYAVRTYTPPRDQTVVIVRDRVYGGWHSLVLEFDAEAERIGRINFGPATPPEGAAGAQLSQSDFLEEVRQAVSRGCQSDVFSGAVLVAQGDEVLFTSACGEASKRFRVENNVETRFNIGSINKMFTASAIMQLVEEDRLRLNDPISHYIDDTWLPAEITGRVTIHHLLTHTSGLGSYFNETFMNSSRALYRELDDFKPLVQGDTLAFEPGAEFRYSNTGMLLLGVVIESVTGQSYFEYVRSRIYGPAGMPNSDSFSMDEPVPNLAMGYIPAPASVYGWRNNLFHHVIKGGPAGGGFSTVHDLHGFARALLDRRLVSEESLNRMWSSHSQAGYGYGFSVADGPAGKVVGHSGGFPGLNANLDIFPESGYVVVVLSNYDQAASPLARHIKNLIGRLQRS